MSRRARSNHQRGKYAEYLALGFLMLKGYLPLALRYKTPVGEIDLVMRRGHTLVFVEVKARPSHGAAAEAVHTTNQSRVTRAAQFFLQHYPHYQSLNLRFDVCLVAWYRLPHHLKNAF